MARLDPIPPDQLDPEQRALHDEMEPMIAEHLNGFVSHRADGALIGPFAPMVHFPAWGDGAWRQTRSLMDQTGLPEAAHEVAILVAGAAHGARHELYAHEAVAEQTDLTPAKIATIAAGERPADLTIDEGVAYDVASTLMRGGPLPGPPIKQDSTPSARRAWPNSCSSSAATAWCPFCSTPTTFQSRAPATAADPTEPTVHVHRARSAPSRLAR